MHSAGKQCGAALITILLILVLGIAALLTGTLDSSEVAIERKRISFDALSHAREALIGDAVTQTPVTSAGYLRLPDLGFKVGGQPAEGSAAPNFSGNSKDYPVIGKLPWRTLELEPLRDGSGECLWYIVSGRFKNTPATDALNWDTQGQIDLADGTGNIIATGLAAMVVAPGIVLGSQNRTISDTAYVQCRGNYDAPNYLDPHDAADAISGALNYFAGSTNSRVASGTGHKLIIMTETGSYNDHFLSISTADIFRPLTRRADFSAQVSALIDDAYFRNAPITGSKGTDSVNCNSLASTNRAFCKNWKEMLLLTALPASAPVIIDGTPSANCNRVLIFGGQKNPSQARLTAADKASPANYLEGTNLTAFATPVANSSSFAGTSTFSANVPEADLLRCLP